MTDFQTVGQQFIQHYYQTMTANRAGLSALYSDQSLMTYEGEQFMGVEQIMGKLNQLPNLAIDSASAVFDFQPSVNEGIFVLVNSSLSIEGGNPMRFTQTFLLQKGGASGYYVANEVFRLSLG